VAANAFQIFAILSEKVSSLAELGTEVLECVNTIWTKKDADDRSDYSMLVQNMAYAFSHLARMDLQAVLPYVTPAVVHQWVRGIKLVYVGEEKQPSLHAARDPRGRVESRGMESRVGNMRKRLQDDLKEFCPDLE
jgi:hypothetical protein